MDMIKWFEEHNNISLLMTVLIAILIFYMSSIESKNIPGISFPLRSVIYHFAIFAFFCFFLLIGLVKGKNNNKQLIFIGVIIAILYGISDEIHQLFVPGRCCSIDDILVDSIGILIAGIGYSGKLFLYPNKRLFKSRII
jgi:hypothetical protein